ncbi:MAG: AI-2E family transporter [Clostridia bacterium]|nr:AI-2E family transporter [Clostridia bacterium]
MNEVKKNFSKWMYWFVLAVAIIVVYKFFDNFTNIFGAIGTFFSTIAPFLAGILLAYLLYIPASRIEEGLKKTKNRFLRKRSRGISVLLTIILSILIIIIIVNVILPVVIESVIELVNNFQGYWNTTVEKINDLPENSILKSDKVKDAIKSIGESIQDVDLNEYINPEKITSYLKSVVGVAKGIFDVFVTIVVSIYILLQRTQIVEFFKKFGKAILDTNTYGKIGKYFSNGNIIFFKFISSQLLDAIIVGVLVTIAMTILKVKYAVLLGFVIGLFNMIPYFGAIIAVALSILITVITGGLSQAIVMAVVVIILQQVDANIINPKIIGNSLEMSPLLVIFAVTVGGAYFGVLGMFLAVPVAAVLKIIVNDFIDKRIEEKT